jgi:hypothetical protein
MGWWDGRPCVVINKGGDMSESKEVTNTVLEVQNGRIGLTELFNHINKGLGIKPEEQEDIEDGKDSK